MESTLALSEIPPTILTDDGTFGLRTNQFGFSLTGVVGQTVVIEASTDLLNWTALATNLLGVDPCYFSDPGCTSIPARFYRARLLQAVRTSDSSQRQTGVQIPSAPPKPGEGRTHR